MNQGITLKPNTTITIFNAVHWFILVGWITGIGMKRDGHNSGYFLSTIISTKIEVIIIFLLSQHEAASRSKEFE